MAEYSALTRSLIAAGLKPRSTRLVSGSPARLMASAEGWVMVRKVGCVPFVMTKDDWLAAPEAQAA